LRVVAITVHADLHSVGEGYAAAKLLQALSSMVDLTVLNLDGNGKIPLAEQLPYANVIGFPEPAFMSNRFERLNAMLVPYFPVFVRKCLAWLRTYQESNLNFELVHQMLPYAARYALPFQRIDNPYIIGPLAGSLATPSGFENDFGPVPWYTRLRKLDQFRFCYDPFLRRTFQCASEVLLAAPYMKDVLQPLPIENSWVLMPWAHEGLKPRPSRSGEAGVLRLLHVGRVVRTKGLRDTIRALAHLNDLPSVTLVSAGAGPDLERCKVEVENLGLSERVSFLGHVPRKEIERLYREADAFCFPSFREPLGHVVFEAMAQRLPVITTDRGGPNNTVNDTCGFRVSVEHPQSFSRDIASAIRKLATDPKLRITMGTAAFQRVKSFGTWDDRARELVQVYERILKQGNSADQSTPPNRATYQRCSQVE